MTFEQTRRKKSRETSDVGDDENDEVDTKKLAWVHGQTDNGNDRNAESAGNDEPNSLHEPHHDDTDEGDKDDDADANGEGTAAQSDHDGEES